MSEGHTDQKLPPGFIDALIGYAIDPVSWESLALELDRVGLQLTNLDPSELLTALSQAEALAWQLKGQTRIQPGQPGCTFYLLDNSGQVLDSADTHALSDYCRIIDNKLTFSDRQTQAQFDDALKILQQGQTKQVLLELRSALPYCRYGYLVRANDLPAALIRENTAHNYGLLVASADAGEQTSGVLRSSFGLTQAEVAVCQQLSTGVKLKEVAKQLNISTNTARNHLQSIFDKTHINRQGDLILMMTQLSVILSVIGANGEAHQLSSKTPNFPPYQFALVNDNTSAGKPTHGGRSRRLAYRRYGSGSRVIVYFHESVSCSRLPYGTLALCDTYDLSVIAPERPGSGFSDECDGYDFNTVARDVEALIDQLQIEKVSLIGYISGGGHALATAARLQNRVERVMLIAARGTGGFSYQQSTTLASLRRNLTSQPWLLSTFFNILRNRANKETNRRLLERVYGAAPQDRDFLQQNPELMDHLVDTSLESLTVSAAGVAGEIRAYTHPAVVELQHITAPIVAWHGDQDTLASFADLQQELAGIEFEHRLFAGWGSLILHRFWAEILATLKD